jgi:hypothetical protein
MRRLFQRVLRHGHVGTRGGDAVAVLENWREMSICRSNDVNVNSGHNANDVGGIRRHRTLDAAAGAQPVD